LNEEDHPRLLKYLDGIRVINISAGGWHSSAITECNDLYMWGWNHSGQLGISNSPGIKCISDEFSFSQILIDKNFNCKRKNNSFLF
jgi:alpha-tubulin suppressor-like RCC1 family protein